MQLLGWRGELFVNLVCTLAGEHKNMKDLHHEEFFVLLMIFVFISYFSILSYKRDVLRHLTPVDLNIPSH